jgi:hypothetical protein
MCAVSHIVLLTVRNKIFTMTKSRIVSYSSEEVKQLPDQSDWEGNAAMTDEEIHAAIASDPDEADLGSDWMVRGTIIRNEPRFVMLINAKAQLPNLIVHKVYKVIREPVERKDGEQRDLLGLIDETGKSSLYPAEYFVPVQFPISAEQSFELETA